MASEKVFNVLFLCTHAFHHAHHQSKKVEEPPCPIKRRLTDFVARIAAETVLREVSKRIGMHLAGAEERRSDKVSGFVGDVILL